MHQKQINLPKYDTSPLFETIKRHFPVGLLRRTEEEQMLYRAYPGLELYVTAIQDAIHKTSTFEGIWKPVEKELSSLTGLPVVGTTLGQAPCYSSFLKVRQEQVGTLTRHFEIHVFVSVIGPYFTVLGKDLSEIVLGDKLIRPTNFYMVSPFDKDEGLFMTIVDVMKAQFPGYRFVPHCFYNLKIPDFEVPYSDNEENFVFNGLFNQEFRSDHSVIGNSYYGAEEWIRSGYEPPQGQWIILPPIQA